MAGTRASGVCENPSLRDQNKSTHPPVTGSLTSSFCVGFFCQLALLTVLSIPIVCSAPCYQMVGDLTSTSIFVTEHIIFLLGYVRVTPSPRIVGLVLPLPSERGDWVSSIKTTQCACDMRIKTRLHLSPPHLLLRPSLVMLKLPGGAVSDN